MTNQIKGSFDLASVVIGLYRDGGARAVEHRDGPPPRIDGFTVGAPLMTREPPHGGEMHPDGDELLFLISGKLTVVLEDSDPPRHVELNPGQAVVVPRGVWHRVLLAAPSQILHITPGPGGKHRPVAPNGVA